MELNIIVLEDWSIVLPAATEEKSASGIYIPSTSRPTSGRGVIVGCGPGKTAQASGQLIPSAVKVGDSIVYDIHSVTEEVINGVPYHKMRQSSIIYINHKG